MSRWVGSIVKRLPFLLLFFHFPNSVYTLICTFQMFEALIADLLQETGLLGVLDHTDLSVKSAGTSIRSTAHITRARYVIQVIVAALYLLGEKRTPTTTASSEVSCPYHLSSAS